MKWLAFGFALFVVVSTIGAQTHDPFVDFELPAEGCLRPVDGFYESESTGKVINGESSREIVPPMMIGIRAETGLIFLLTDLNGDGKRETDETITCEAFYFTDSVCWRNNELDYAFSWIAADKVWRLLITKKPTSEWIRMNFIMVGQW